MIRCPARASHALREVTPSPGGKCLTQNLQDLFIKRCLFSMFTWRRISTQNRKEQQEKGGREGAYRPVLSITRSYDGQPPSGRGMAILSELQQRSGGAAALLQGLYDFLPGSLLQDLGRFLGGIWGIVAMSHVKHDSREFHAKHERHFGKTDYVIGSRNQSGGT